VSLISRAAFAAAVTNFLLEVLSAYPVGTRLPITISSVRLSPMNSRIHRSFEPIKPTLAPVFISLSRYACGRSGQDAEWESERLVFE
jgi:hypothetical protein